MGKMSFCFLIIIIVYLAYSFVKSRPRKENNPFLEKKEENKEVFLNNIKDYEKVVIVASIAAFMGAEKYRIKRVYCKGDEPQQSSWKAAGRNESMLRRIFR